MSSIEIEKEKSLDLRRLEVIRERIESEYRKHGNTESLDWMTIAAIKINNEIKHIK